MKLLFSSTLLGAAALCALASWSTAQIERLNLTQITTRSDDAIVGKIVKREVFRVDHPIDGPELYFTTIWIDGQSLVNDVKTVFDITFHGGFIDEEQGVYNSEAPSFDETRVGREIVAFYHWTDNMGGDVAGNVLFASHGGLYTTFGRDRTVVQGRGEGYAIRQNVPLDELRTQIKAIREQQHK